MKRLYFSLIGIITFVGFAALALADPGTTWDQQINGHGRFKVLKEFGGAAVLDKETGRVWEQSPSTELFPWTVLSTPLPGATAPDALSHCYQLEVGAVKGGGFRRSRSWQVLWTPRRVLRRLRRSPPAIPLTCRRPCTGRLLPTPAMPAARGPWASPAATCSTPIRPPPAKCGACAADRGLMGFSDWVFSYLVILRLGVQGETLLLFPVWQLQIRENGPL